MYSFQLSDTIWIFLGVGSSLFLPEDKKASFR